MKEMKSRIQEIPRANVSVNKRENGLRMMIEKYEYLNGNQDIRPWFKDTISNKMLKAWEEYNQSN